MTTQELLSCARSNLTDMVLLTSRAAFHDFRKTAECCEAALSCTMPEVRRLFERNAREHWDQACRTWESAKRY